MTSLALSNIRASQNPVKLDASGLTISDFAGCRMDHYSIAEAKGLRFNYRRMLLKRTSRQTQWPSLAI